MVDMSAVEDQPTSREPTSTADALPARILSRGDGPLYRQLNTVLRDVILAGGHPAGTVLPREADIAARYGVSLITVRQAMRDLELEGLIQKRAAKPAVVVAPRARKPAFAFESLAAIAASTRDRRLAIGSYRRETSAYAAQAFGLPAKERLYCLRALLYVGDQPACRCTFYFPPQIGMRLRRSDFDDVVVFRSVQRHLGLKLAGARINVRAELADAELAAALSYEVGAPILVTEMMYRAADGELIELTINENRADFFSLSFQAPNDFV